MLWRFDIKNARTQIKPIAFSVDVHGTAQVAWAASERHNWNLHSASLTHVFDTFQWFERPDEYRCSDAWRFGRHVQAKIHAIYKVDVRKARAAKERRISGSWPSVTMAGWVNQRQIGFGFHDPPGQGEPPSGSQRNAVVERRADETAGNVYRRSGKEISRVRGFGSNISSHLDAL